jgi:hypothetical protein
VRPTPPAPAGDGRATPDQWEDVARLPTRTVARDHPHQWRASGLLDGLADLGEPIEAVWAAVQLALAGAHQHTVARTLGLPDDTAQRIIIATTEQLIVATIKANSADS